MSCQDISEKESTRALSVCATQARGGERDARRGGAVLLLRALSGGYAQPVRPLHLFVPRPQAQARGGERARPLARLLGVGKRRTTTPRERATRVYSPVAWPAITTHAKRP